MINSLKLATKATNLIVEYAEKNQALGSAYVKMGDKFYEIEDVRVVEGIGGDKPAIILDVSSDSL